MDKSLQQIIDWVQRNSKQTLEHLNPPATDEAIGSVESQLGVTLPHAFKALLKRFDGEDGQTWLALLGNGNQLLPCEQIIEYHELDQRAAKQFYDPKMETIEFWKDRVANQVIFVKGAVKPLLLHPKWIPITSMNGDVIRYLDYDPAPGGTIAQVIEVDAEGCSYQVLAGSFDDFLALYAQQLEDGLFHVDDEGYIECSEEDDMDWGVPDWLKNADG